MQSAVSKGEQSTAKTKRGDHCLMRDGAESKDRPKPRQSVDFGGQKPAAVRDFARFGLVLRRDAANGISDAHAPKLQAVVRMGGIVALGEPELAQSPIEQPAGVIAGERAPGPVRATQSGS